MLILDRFDGDTALIEADEGMLRIKRTLLAEDVQEGDVLMLLDGMYRKDDQATAARRERMRRLLHRRTAK